LVYLLGEGLPRNPERALELFRRSAETGHVVAAAKLGWMLVTGAGSPVDRPEGLRWLRKAAMAGYPEAMYNIYTTFCKAPDLVSSDEALSSLRLAAEAGFLPAVAVLEKCRI
jgi:TPR repeat protein